MVLASGSIQNGEIYLWKTSPFAELFLFDENLNLGNIRSIAFSPYGSMIAAGGSNGGIKVVDDSSGIVLYKKNDAHGSSAILAVVWTDNSSIASGDSNGSIKLWQLDDSSTPLPFGVGSADSCT